MRLQNRCKHVTGDFLPTASTPQMTAAAVTATIGHRQYYLPTSLGIIPGHRRDNRSVASGDSTCAKIASASRLSITNRLAKPPLNAASSAGSLSRPEATNNPLI